MHPWALVCLKRCPPFLRHNSCWRVPCSVPSSKVTWHVSFRGIPLKQGLLCSKVRSGAQGCRTHRQTVFRKFWRNFLEYVREECRNSWFIYLQGACRSWGISFPSQHTFGGEPGERQERQGSYPAVCFLEKACRQAGQLLCEIQRVIRVKGS